MSDKYILDGHSTIPCDDLMAWARWFETANRQVAKDHLEGDVRVSTVFLGLDHSFGEGPPKLFETMIFGGPHDQHQERCSTWEGAEAMHARALKIARGEVGPVSFTDDIDRRMERQNAEFEAVDRLCKEYRRLTLTPIVDDDYPEVRADYERAVHGLIKALADNGRINE